MTNPTKHAAAEALEDKLVGFLLQFEPAQELRICDVKTIARYAKQIAFSEFLETS